MEISGMLLTLKMEAKTKGKKKKMIRKIKDRTRSWKNFKNPNVLKVVKADTPSIKQELQAMKNMKELLEIKKLWRIMLRNISKSK